MSVLLRIHWNHIPFNFYNKCLKLSSELCHQNCWSHVWIYCIYAFLCLFVLSVILQLSFFAGKGAMAEVVTIVDVVKDYVEKSCWVISESVTVQNQFSCMGDSIASKEEIENKSLHLSDRRTAASVKLTGGICDPHLRERTCRSQGSVCCWGITAWATLMKSAE